LRVIALAGNPNSGKTTLFNAISGGSEKTGNWPGVTVEKKEASLAIGREEFRLVDLPGTYSLNSSSPEERIAGEFLQSGRADAVVIVADGGRLLRNLPLTRAILETGRPAVVALNFADELEQNGAMPDAEELSRALGVPVIPVSGRKRTGITELLTAARAANSPSGPPDWDRVISMARGQEARLSPADRLFLGKYTAYPILALAAFLLFFTVFGPPGQILSEWAGRIAERAPALLRLVPLPEFLRGMLEEGVLPGAAGVLAFLPVMLLLFFLLEILDGTGYLARAAVLLDRPLSKLGLSGRAFFPLMLGFGCTTAAILGARAAEGQRERRLTALLTPFLPCAARLPVYALMTNAFFGGAGWIAAAGLYLMGILCLIPASHILRRLPGLAAEDGCFLLELPPIRPPDMEALFRSLRARAKDFLLRVGSVILALSVVIWFLRNYTPALTPAEDISESLFALLGRGFSVLLSPMGLSDWRQGAALLSGLAAKEGIVTGLEILYAPVPLAEALPAAFTEASCLAFLAFTALEAPCISALATLRREAGCRAVWISILLSAVFSYTAGIFAYQIGRWLF